MSYNKRKIFPQIKKKLKSFLTDESGKISKKDVFALAAGAILLGGVENAIAGGHNNITHNSGQGNGGHANVGLTSANDNEGTETRYGPWLGRTCVHSSGIVNGHFSGIPSVSNDFRLQQTGHGSHSSSGSGSGSGSGTGSGTGSGSGSGSGSGY